MVSAFSPARLARGVLVSVLIVAVIESSPPLTVPARADSTAAPPLYAGDRWTYRYSTGETAIETVLRIEACGPNPTFIDEVRKVGAWTRTVWLNRDWSETREVFEDNRGTTTVTFTPPARGPDWPLAVGKQWWINTTASLSFESRVANPSSQKEVIARLVKVVARMNVTVPAGQFDSYLIEAWEDQILLERGWFSLQSRTTVSLTVYPGDGSPSYNREMTSYVNGSKIQPTDASSILALLALCPPLAAAYNFVYNFWFLGAIVAILVTVSALLRGGRRSLDKVEGRRWWGNCLGQPEFAGRQGRYFRAPELMWIPFDILEG